MFIYAGYASLVFIVIMIVIGIITNFSKKRSEKEEALRQMIISFVFYGAMLGFLVCLFIFQHGFSPVIDKTTNLSELQNIIEKQNQYLDDLLFLFISAIFYFFVLVLPSIYSFGKTLVAEENNIETKKETNILGLREI
jgi:predicted PurR-regulated permease PerM